MAVLTCEVLTPERTVVQAEVEYVLLPGVDGQFGVLANHQPLMAALDIEWWNLGLSRGSAGSWPWEAASWKCMTTNSR